MAIDVSQLRRNSAEHEEHVWKAAQYANTLADRFAALTLEDVQADPDETIGARTEIVSAAANAQAAANYLSEALEHVTRLLERHERINQINERKAGLRFVLGQQIDDGDFDLAEITLAELRQVSEEQ